MTTRGVRAPALTAPLRLGGQLLGIVTSALVTFPRLVLTAGTLVGQRGRPLVLRVHVVVQRDDAGAPVTDLEHVRAALGWAIEVFRTAADVHVVPIGWRPSEPLDADAADSRFVTVAEQPSTPATLDVTCTVNAWRADLGATGAGFRAAIRAAGGAVLPSYGAAVYVMAVRAFRTRHLGCSLGPMTDYVTVRFSGEPTTLGHELGHACGLWHTRSDGLMDRKPSRIGRLARWQRWVVRASRHATRA